MQFIINEGIYGAYHCCSTFLLCLVQSELFFSLPNYAVFYLVAIFTLKDLYEDHHHHHTNMHTNRFAVINMAMMGTTKSLEGFGRESPAVLRERASGQYSALEYLLAKVSY